MWEAPPAVGVAFCAAACGPSSRKKGSIASSLVMAAHRTLPRAPRATAGLRPANPVVQFSQSAVVGGRHHAIRSTTLPVDWTLAHDWSAFRPKRQPDAPGRNLGPEASVAR